MGAGDNVACLSIHSIHGVPGRTFACVSTGAGDVA